MSVSERKQCSSFIMLNSFPGTRTQRRPSLPSLSVLDCSYNCGGMEAKLHNWQIFIPALHPDSVWRRILAVIWGFFLNKSRKFGKMLGNDQVQMVASNQQAAGVYSTAAESRRSVPSIPVDGSSVLHCIKYQ